MNISFENPDKINGLLTLTIEKEDYEKDVEKTLKDYRKKANVPGFRPGMVPMGMIKRQYGNAVKVDIINKLVGEKIYGYVRENNIQMLGEPMPNEEKQQQLDLKGDGPFEFVFDIAVAPEFKAELTSDDTIDYYTIDVDDKLIDQQVDMFRSRAGHYDKAETYDAAQNDMLKGNLRELDADGNVKEGGITVEAAVLMPEYIKVEEQKSLFNEATVGRAITFNPKKAYPDNDSEIASLLKIKKEQAAELTSDFTYVVTEISRYVKAEVNQDLFDQVFGEGIVKDEQEFREKIAVGMKVQFASDSDYKFLLDVRRHMESKVGELTFPDALLKKIMLKNSKDKTEKAVDENYDASIKALKWHLIKEQLVAANAIKVDDKDLKEVAKQVTRIQFAQYGMNNVPEEYIEKYADSMVKDQKNIESIVDRAIDIKLTAALKKVVKMNDKTISLDDFNKMMQER